MAAEGYELWTIQMGGWRYAQQLEIPMFDITVKSGIGVFAPSWENLFAYKQGEINNEEYTRRYLAKVIPTVHTHTDEWLALAHHPKMAFACYCRRGDFCHRHIFIGLMAEFLQKLGQRVTIMGELVAPG